MPDGTAYADYANVHNYIYHPHSRHGLFGNFGITWSRRFRGYTQQQLDTLPRVTTETGAKIEGPVTEQMQALDLMNIYLAQFKRGYAYTAVYLCATGPTKTATNPSASTEATIRRRRPRSTCIT